MYIKTVLIPTHVILHNRKDFEISQLASKIEDEQSVAVQCQKRIKELQVPTVKTC